MRQGYYSNHFSWDPENRTRSGTILFLGVFVIIIFCGFAAFAIDLGYIALTQAQLQNAADAAALAAVLELKEAGGASRDEIRAAALAEALKAASYNKADQRPVVLKPEEVIFGNRHFDNNTDKFVTDWEPDPAVANLPLNAIKVDIHFNETSGDRSQLSLFFGPVIDRKFSSVSGASKAHLTPRDLAFVIDISNSMNDLVQGSTYQSDRFTMIRAWLDVPSATTLTTGHPLNENIIDHDVNSSAVSVTSNTTNILSTSSQFRIKSNNHGLINDEVVRVIKTSGSDTTYTGRIQGTWRVSVVDANQFVLLGSTFSSPTTSTIKWYRKGVYPNLTGGIRVRTHDPHGLNTGVQIRLYGVGNVANAGGTNGGLFRIKRVPGNDYAFDLLNVSNNLPVDFNNASTALGQGRDGYHTDKTGDYVLVPDRNNASGLNFATLGIPLTSNFNNDDDYKAAWLRCLDNNGSASGGTNIWGSDDNAQRLAELEFPSGVFDPVYVNNGVETGRYGTPTDHPINRQDGSPFAYPKGHPWKHWKWKAYCDWTLFDEDTADFTGDITIFTKNLNVADGRADTNGIPDWTSFSYDQYSNFCLTNGYVPALRGQPMIGRDMNDDGTLDIFPSSLGAEYADYPDFAGFYSKGAYLSGYDGSVIDFSEGSSSAGLHPLNVPDLPFSYVRQATLLGINAMISDENVGNDAFDQVGMITFGTRANVELDLTNNLAQSLKQVNCRCVVTGSNLNITPKANGNTNIGGALRKAIELVKYSPRSRSFTNKTIALLTDGQPNISPASGNTGSEFTPPTTDTISNSDSLGNSYANYWADQAEAEGIVVHTIGVGVAATTGGPATLLQGIADKTGGQYFPVQNPAADQQLLNNIFIAIGKDKLGKLFN